jgi:hypothetical protein
MSTELIPVEIVKISQGVTENKNNFYIKVHTQKLSKRAAIKTDD